MVNKYKLANLNDNIIGYDLLICFSSFESRCLSVATNIHLNKITKAIIFYNEDNIEHIGKNKIELESMLKEKATSIGLMHSNPIYTADKMKVALCNVINDFKGELKTVLLDITTFTHETLLMIVKLLQIVLPEAKVTCAYTNAYEYNSGNKRNDKWLSKGVSEIRSVLGYPGSILPAQKTHLIIIVGYEYERASSIINALEPSSVALGFGRSDNATTQKDNDANEHYTQLVEQMATNYLDIDCFEVMCNDPFATCDKLLLQINDIGSKNVLIVPLNNKISTIGAALAALKNEDIQLCYAPALIYNYSDYSKPGDSCYLFEIGDVVKNDQED